MTQNPTTVTELLAQAAQLAAESGCDLESFMKSAWTSFVDSQPGLREQLELARTIAQLEELRERGLVGEA
jgi:hypothetical protein